MPKNKSAEIRVRPVRKDRPDVRALARVLIELALAEPAELSDAATEKAETETPAKRRSA